MDNRIPETKTSMQNPNYRKNISVVFIGDDVFQHNTHVPIAIRDWNITPLFCHKQFKNDHPEIYRETLKNANGVVITIWGHGDDTKSRTREFLDDVAIIGRNRSKPIIFASIVRSGEDQRYIPIYKMAPITCDLVGHSDEAFFMEILQKVINNYYLEPVRQTVTAGSRQKCVILKKRMKKRIDNFLQDRLFDDDDDFILFKLGR